MFGVKHDRLVKQVYDTSGDTDTHEPNEILLVLIGFDLWGV